MLYCDTATIHVNFVYCSYGDLVPMTTLARLCTFFWIFFGLSISAIITATVTDTLTSAEFSNINGRMVRKFMFCDTYWIKYYFNPLI